MATKIWVFDAIPRYFKLYQMAGAALREPTILDTPRWVGISGSFFREPRSGSGNETDRLVEPRTIVIPVPVRDAGKLRFEKELTMFLDGVVDIARWESAVQVSPWTLGELAAEGISLKQRLGLRFLAAVLARRLYLDHYSPSLVRSTNAFMRSQVAGRWSFSNVGT